MLMLNSKIETTPVMGLQTGSQLATVGEALIDPANLQIVAYNLENNSYSNEPMFVRIAELRELSRVGFIVDSGEDFILQSDVIKIRDLIELDFHLIGMKVIDEDGNNLGKIIDFAFSFLDFRVQQIIVKRPLFRSFNTPELTIHRNQITMIDNEKITVKSETEKKSIKRAEKTENFVPNYVNPFHD